MVENDLKPCYVFDGKPPALKSNVVRAVSRAVAAPVDALELTHAFPSAPDSSKSALLDGRMRRKARRRPRRLVRRVPKRSGVDVGRTLVANACDGPTGTTDDIDKLSRRQVKVTREHNEACRRLLTLMGIPWVIVRTAALFLCVVHHLTSILC